MLITEFWVTMSTELNYIVAKGLAWLVLKKKLPLFELISIFFLTMQSSDLLTFQQ